MNRINHCIQCIFSGLLLLLLTTGCQQTTKKEQQDNIKSQLKTEVPFYWENANVYFLLIDRFHNGDSTNDYSFDRKKDGATLRNFEGGDIRGIIKKLDEGYFDNLGITALWFTPPIEQIKSFTDEGTGKTYAYHGYWGRDWTSIDPNFGTMNDLEELIGKAHEKGIRILMDVVINHTGPVTAIDTQWPDSWVRTSPKCEYTNYENTVRCTLVENLPDVLTESNNEVELPPFLIQKWKMEGRYEKEVEELDEFFERTGYPKAPRYFFIKWLCDYILAFGVDGFRIDTAKHTDPELWKELFKEALKALAKWKAENPKEALDDLPFFMVGEVYNYELKHGRAFPMGEGVTVDFFENGFKSLINFSFKVDAERAIDSVYAAYDKRLNSDELRGKSIMNYLSSHDDGSPFDKERQKTFETATKLLLAPGATQIYYGDEIARPLVVPNAVGDANLRSMMDWDQLNDENKLLKHWQKLGQFRKTHPAVGMGRHERIKESPYTFKRTYAGDDFVDEVIVVMEEVSEIDLSGIAENNSVWMDEYSGKTGTVTNGRLFFTEPQPIRLLSKVE
jgi:alpha-amylase